MTAELDANMALSVVKALEAQADAQRIVTSALRQMLEQRIVSPGESRVASEAGSDDAEAAARLRAVQEPSEDPPAASRKEPSEHDAASECNSVAPSTMTPGGRSSRSTDATSTTSQDTAKRSPVPVEDFNAVIVAWCDALATRLGGCQTSLTFEFLVSMFPQDSAVQRVLSQMPRSHMYRPVHSFIERVVQRCNEQDGVRGKVDAIFEWGDAGKGGARGRRRRTQSKVPQVTVEVAGDKTEQLGDWWEKMRDVARQMRREFEEGDAAARKALFGPPWRVRADR